MTLWLSDHQTGIITATIPTHTLLRRGLHSFSELLPGRDRLGNRHSEGKVNVNDHQNFT